MQSIEWNSPKFPPRLCVRPSGFCVIFLDVVGSHGKPERALAYGGGIDLCQGGKPVLGRARLVEQEAFCKLRYAGIDEHDAAFSRPGIEQQLVLNSDDPAVKLIETDRVSCVVLVSDQ